MQLTEEQKKKIAAWAEAGCSLAELQKRINEELGLNLTFMEVRLLALDNDISIKDRGGTTGAVDLTKVPQREDEHGAAGTDPGGVSVEIDKLNKPGAILNGTVTFSDGVRADWFLDRAGRLAIEADQPGYRPGESDLRSFQEQMSALLQSRGF